MLQHTAVSDAAKAFIVAQHTDASTIRPVDQLGSFVWQPVQVTIQMACLPVAKIHIILKAPPCIHSCMGMTAAMAPAVQKGSQFHQHPSTM